jgi:CO/xanthine dehydrogenase Mo-binding subunit
VPTALDAPPFETILVEVPYPHGPGGAKGVGEIPMDGGAPCIAAAIEHALEGDVAWSEGSALLPDLPLLPERIYERVVRARGAA